MKFLLALALVFSFNTFAEETVETETVVVTEERDLCAEMAALTALMDENAVMCEAVDEAAEDAETDTADEAATE